MAADFFDRLDASAPGGGGALFDAQARPRATLQGVIHDVVFTMS